MFSLALIATLVAFLGVVALAVGGVPTLRYAAAKHRLLVGSCVKSDALQTDAMYREVLAREFSVLTPENEMKWGVLSTARGQYDFSRADALVRFAQEHNLLVHGHCFVWHHQNPEWLDNCGFDRATMLEVLQEHIQALTRRYKGKVPIWDIVNEAFDDSPQARRRDSIWQTRVGADYIEQAFVLARAAAPEVKLLYNDYGIENINAKSDAVYELLKDLRARNIPVDGVGFQGHVLPAQVDPKSFAENMRRFAALGLEVYVTELDVRLKDPATAEDLELQAREYGALLECCMNEPACKAVMLWGFTDRFSWIPQFFKGYGSALLFDAEYQPKPAYYALHKQLAGTKPV